MVAADTVGKALELGSLAELGTGEIWERARLLREVGRRLQPLRMLGVGPGDRVLLAHGGHPRFFADLLAVWELGASAACINPGLTAYELRKVCDFTTARALLIADECPLNPPYAVPTVALDREAGQDTEERFVPGSGYGLDEPALILFTSGTTGTPKGVVLSHRALLARVSLNRRHIGDRALARTLCLLPTHFGHGLIGNCLTALLSGHRLHLHCSSGMESAVDLGERIIRHGITFLSSVPSFWTLALRLSDAVPSGHLQKLNIGSAPLSRQLWEDIRRWSGTDNVTNMYGMTETANWFAGASLREHGAEDGFVGRPWGGAVRVLDADGVPRSSGEGELLVQTPSLMSGYLHREDLTDAAFIDGWYRTGDTGTVDPTGAIRLSGRLKCEINRGGIKVQPEELDLLLERHSSIAEACAFGVPDAISGEAIAVAIRGEPGHTLSPDSLRRWCSARIRTEAVPERWFLVSEIPKTERGKVNRELLRRNCLESGA